jgi:CDP-paratose 2-epimerase
MSSSPKAVITGGAGFIGTNIAARLAAEGMRVVVFDDLSRQGVARNLRWLRQAHGEVTFVRGDVRDQAALRRVLVGSQMVIHLAAQVAVTTSLDQPLTDFAVNAEGTVKLLEEVRRLENPPFLLFTSTNKVYGSLADLPLRRFGKRWLPAEARVRVRGLAEDRPLQFRTPYGCSKGAADQYVLDYAHSYGLPAVVFRMSCIYGPHQHGTEDQGWVAHFAIRALQGRPITVYGDGAQVRDLLFVNDLVEAVLLARDHVDTIGGNAFNIGGGVENAVGVAEVLELIGELAGRPPRVSFAQERPGDQRYYVADTTRFRQATGWTTTVDPQDGIERLFGWLEHRQRLQPGRRSAAIAR